MLQKGQTPVVLCIGRIYCDLVFTGVPRMPSLGTETFADGVSLHAGGGAFNSAVAFCLLDCPAALMGVLPAAPFDAAVLRDGREAGVDLSMCAPADPLADPQITVAMTVGDDRAFLSRKAGQASPELDTRHSSCAKIRHLHIGELRTLCENPDLPDRARQAGWTISLDCSWDDELMQKGAEMADLVKKVDVFLPNEAEYSALSQTGLPGDACALTVVKRGALGASAIRGEETLHTPGLPVEHVVDATGAGDAFNGGFLTAWLSGNNLGDCLASGNRCGAAATQQAGGAVGLAKTSVLQGLRV